MTKEELMKDYYADRPPEPYSSDDCPTDWSHIVEYAEDNLEKAYERIAELEAERERLKLNKIVDRNANKLKPYEIPILVFGCLVGLAYIITGIIF